MGSIKFNSKCKKWVWVERQIIIHPTKTLFYCVAAQSIALSCWNVAEQTRRPESATRLIEKHISNQVFVSKVY